MKRRRQGNTGVCGKCNHRKGSLSSLPADDIFLKDEDRVKKAIMVRAVVSMRPKLGRGKRLAMKKRLQSKI
jgi:hypothetical protein